MPLSSPSMAGNRPRPLPQRVGRPSGRANQTGTPMATNPGEATQRRPYHLPELKRVLTTTLKSIAAKRTRPGKLPIVSSRVRLRHCRDERIDPAQRHFTRLSTCTLMTAAIETERSRRRTFATETSCGTERIIDPGSGAGGGVSSRRGPFMVAHENFLQNWRRQS